MNHYSNNKKKWLTGLLLFSLLSIQSATAQLSYRAGAEIEPGYEGWRANEDGTYTLIFGYMNENWEEQPDIEVGENNFFTPGSKFKANELNYSNKAGLNWRFCSA